MSAPVNTPLVNLSLAQRVLAELRHVGVNEFCVCPGGRSAPLIALLTASTSVRCHYFFDERAAAFFALGRIKSTDRPVAVVTTSGTAVGELLPATMEAYYAGLPLILLTADRPRSYRGTGAPQAAEQPGIFGIYAMDIDLADDESVQLASWSARAPLHVNVCFDEPLLDAAGLKNLGRSATAAGDRPLQPQEYAPQKRVLGNFLQATRFPLIVVGGLRPREIVPVREFLLRLGAPVHAEAQSGLREDAALAHLKLNAGDRLLAHCRKNDWNVDAVLRIGSVPVHRLWRDLEARERDIRVCSLSSLPFSGMTRSQLVCAPLDELLAAYRPARSFASPAIAQCVADDDAYMQKLAALLDAEPRAEPSLLRRLSCSIPPRSRVYLGNSLPIRYWDLAATHVDRQLMPCASRGLNGIDGQVSTFLGLCAAGADNWGIFGDLTALYDATAPWILRSLAGAQAQIVVINNAGGRIFERMFPGMPEYLNRHALDFKALAQWWSLAYERWETIPESLGGSTSRILEIVPDAAATQRFHERHGALA